MTIQSMFGFGSVHLGVRYRGSNCNNPGGHQLLEFISEPEFGPAEEYQPDAVQDMAVGTPVVLPCTCY